MSFRSVALAASCFSIVLTCTGQEDPRRAELLRYVEFAMRHDGVVERGRQLYRNEEKTACAKCHSVDGTSSKAGPDLASIGDKFPRRELIQAVLEPSFTIAVGYGATTIETRSDQEVTGIIKQATDAWIELMGPDGKLVRIPTSEITAQRGSTVSLMPEGLEAGLSLQDF